MPKERSHQLQALAQRVVDALPLEVAEEVVLTGSVSRGVADEVSDIEMLIVTPEPLELAACFEHARAAGLEELDTWGSQGTPTQRVSGFRERVPLELIWWSREYAESSIEAILVGDTSPAADAIANGVALRTSGSLSRWQARLSDYPDDIVAARIEEAALTWGGFAPAGLLTLARPGERLARIERMLDDASRVLASFTRSTESGSQRISVSRHWSRHSRLSLHDSRSESKKLSQNQTHGAHCWL